MSDRDQFIARAREVELFASRSLEADERRQFLAIARQWRELAAQAAPAPRHRGAPRPSLPHRQTA